MPYFPSVTSYSPIFFDFVESPGCVWSGDSYGVNLNASMTSGFVWINGQRGPIAAVTARAFTASKDTYVDVLNTLGVFSLVYTEVANNAASPALAANSLRLGIIVSGATIAAATSVNQGQETMVLPIASSIPYAVTDSLGNLICPRDSNRKILGYRQIIASPGVFTTIAQVIGLTCPVIVPTGRKVRVTCYANALQNSSAGQFSQLSIWDGVVNSGPQLARSWSFETTATGPHFVQTFALTTPTSNSKTYNVGIDNNGLGTVSFSNPLSTNPSYIMVELA